MTIKKTDISTEEWVKIAKEKQSFDFIAIEGPDGCGKTTLCERLKKDNYPIIRGIPKEFESTEIKQRMIQTNIWISSAMFFLAGVIENQKVLKNNNQKTIISDRSVWSTLAVHYKKNPKLLPDLHKLLNLTAEYIIFPKKTIVLNTKFENILSRISQKSIQEQTFDKSVPLNPIAHNNEIIFFKY